MSTRTYPADRRRSHRILLPVAVRISGELPNGRRVEEETSTLVVSAHGALLQLREAVHTGQTLPIKNLSTGEEASCTVRDITAVPGGLTEIGLEFTETRPRFWRVAFPPPDCSSRSPEAKRFALSPSSPQDLPSK